MINHLVVVPVFNEEKHLIRFIESVLLQTCRPSMVLFVDDGSTDSTSKIIKKYSKKNEGIKYVYKDSYQKKSQGAKVVRAFNYGLSKIDYREYEVISKLDADLELPRNYFEILEETINLNSHIGIAGGYILEKSDSEWIRVPQSSYHIRGALKSYRKECFQKIGGLDPILGWDGLDEMKALYYKWETKIIEVGVKHYRPSAIDYDTCELNYKKGIANYKNGGNLLLAIIRSIVKSRDKPIVISGYNFIKGHIYAMIKREEKNVSNEMAKFINKFHMKRLIRFKRY